MSITQLQLKSILHYNPDTGIFTRLSSLTRKDLIGKPCGTVSKDGYIQIGIKKKIYKAHRLAFLYMTGSFPNITDHIDHVRNNNKWDNLRSVSLSDNAKNSSLQSSNKTGFHGVEWLGYLNKFRASIKINGKLIHLGVFKKKEDAVKCRKKAELEYGFHSNHGSTTVLY